LFHEIVNLLLLISLTLPFAVCYRCSPIRIDASIVVKKFMERKHDDDSRK